MKIKVTEHHCQSKIVGGKSIAQFAKWQSLHCATALQFLLYCGKRIAQKFRNLNIVTAMNSYTLETAHATDRDELLAFLLDAFRTNDPNHPAFDTLYPDLFDATDEAMSRHRVIRDEAGRICACVGSYPMRVRIGQCAVEIFGIGQVSCSPQLRGGGRMSALLADVCESMERSGAALAWLSGRRDRYAHFGWDVAGTNLHSGFDARSVGKAPSGWSIEQIAVATAAERIWQLRNRAAVREEVSPETWTTRLMRGGKPHRVFIATRADGAAAKDSCAEAFCVMQAGEGEELLEWAGETDGIHAILAHALQTQKRVRVTCAPQNIDPAARLFWDSADWSGASLANIRILNLQKLLDSYAPLLNERIPAGASVRLVIAENDAKQIDCAQLGAATPAATAPTLTLDRKTMARTIFGPLAPSTLITLPEELRWLDRVFPLPFCLPSSSHV